VPIDTHIKGGGLSCVPQGDLEASIYGSSKI
jgi:hypothetical protein